MAVSRKSARYALAEILAEACPQASEVRAYQPVSIGPTPGVYIRSRSADRPPLTVRGKFTRFVFDIIIVVAQSSKNKMWTPEMAEDLLDDLEASVCEALSENRVVEGAWDSINYAVPSVIEYYLDDGLPYLMEAIKVVVEVTKDA